MTKRFWVNATPYDRAIVTAAIEAGAEAVLVPAGKTAEVKRLGKITTIAEDGDLQWGRDVERVRITTEQDEQRVHRDLLTIIDNDDWTIIPLENLIASSANLIQSVRSAEEAELALQVMERGADGVLLISGDVDEIRRTGAVVAQERAEQLALEVVRIEAITAVTTSDRCCIDTACLLPPGVGLLVGNHANALFLVHNENLQTPYCAARPFRVNAGAVHAYVQLPGNRTKYLCELTTGDEVLAADPTGRTQVVAVGRNKIERRPTLLISARNGTDRRVSLILQNAETVRLTRPGGEPAPVTALQPGDEVLARLGDDGGRHFGQPVAETIREQ